MDEEKPSIEKRSTSGSLAPPLATPEEERHLVRKIDLHILPITCLLYLCACQLVFLTHGRPDCLLLMSCVNVDLDRSNLGNARLQGLPQETLNGDPTGVLYNWVNSAFYFSYVSSCPVFFFGKRSARLSVNADLRCHSTPFKITQSDPLPSSCNDLFQTFPTVLLDGSNRHRMGNLFHFIGMYWFLPLTVFCDQLKLRLISGIAGFYRRLRSISEV